MRSTLLAIPLGLALTACTPASPGSTPSVPQETPVAIATTTHLGSILSDITQCAGTTSATLMGPGDDPHDFSVSSREVADLTRAKLVVTSGLGLEAGIASALDGARADGATILAVAPRLDPLRYADIEARQAEQHAGHDHTSPDTHDEGHDHGEFDPHVHMDAGRMARAATVIGDELAQITGNQKYTQCGQQVRADLEKTDAQVREILAAVPGDKRVMITDHEAYNYFADAYGFEIAGVVIPGGGTDAEPSSAELADLVAVVREDRVSAIFSNNTVNPRLVDAVAREAGTQIKVVQLYEGSVGPPGSGAETYADLMLTDARLVADALR